MTSSTTAARSTPSRALSRARCAPATSSRCGERSAPARRPSCARSSRALHGSDEAVSSPTFVFRQRYDAPAPRHPRSNTSTSTASTTRPRAARPRARRSVRPGRSPSSSGPSALRAGSRPARSRSRSTAPATDRAPSAIARLEREDPGARRRAGRVLGGARRRRRPAARRLDRPPRRPRARASARSRRCWRTAGCGCATSTAWRSGSGPGSFTGRADRRRVREVARLRQRAAAGRRLVVRRARSRRMRRLPVLTVVRGRRGRDLRAPAAARARGAPPAARPPRCWTGCCAGEPGVAACRREYGGRVLGDRRTRLDRACAPAPGGRPRRRDRPARPHPGPERLAARRRPRLRRSAGGHGARTAPRESRAVPAPGLVRRGELRIDAMTQADLPAVLRIEALSFSTSWPTNAFSNEIRDNKLAHYFVGRLDGRDRRVRRHLGDPRGLAHHDDRGASRLSRPALRRSDAAASFSTRRSRKARRGSRSRCASRTTSRRSSTASTASRPSRRGAATTATTARTRS